MPPEPEHVDPDDANEQELAAWLFEEFAGEEAMEEDLAYSQRLLAQMAAQLNANASGPSIPPGLDEDVMLERYVEEEELGLAGAGFATFPGTQPGLDPRAAQALFTNTNGIETNGLDELDDFDLTDFADF